MKKLYLILPILAGLMFGSSGIFVRTLTQNGIDQTTLLFLRFSLAIIPIAIAIILTDRKLFKAELKDTPLFLVCAICMVGLNLCYNESMNTVPLSLAAVLLSIAPIYVLIFAYVLFREKITSKKVICMVLAILGCVLMTGVLESDLSSIPLFGILSGIGAGLFWAIYLMASKKSIEDGNHTYTILIYCTVFLSLALIPFTDFNQIGNFVGIDPLPAVIFLIIHSTFSFALPYIFSTVSLKYMDSGTSSIFLSGAEPFAALIFGLLIYSEIPSLLMFCGFLLTVGAMTILSRAGSDENPA
ncbi:MAG: DMT family transporter [Methanobrevibacter sp.]|uniref:DMT family transporter n=1 Tax=Methanobrevibacter TaxID=2172 RepID=UPI0025803147|nr:DMT family transporter [Methanobrevibacter sp.]MBR2666157.1 DMT family transporter [Methanobrevibacter sp.]MBR3197438.1 DMT family transporter [Methanobrevibacter sp.]MBR7050387.1 DMT family transporter [Methanobrevibacter sp.]